MLKRDDGPSFVIGQVAPVPGTTYVGDYNPDAAPSGAWGGYSFLDSRYRNGPGGGGQNANQVLGFYQSPDVRTIDQVPSAVATANIAAAANVTSGTAMTLVTTTGAGITVLAASFQYLIGTTIPTGSLAIDGPPGYVGFSQNGAAQFWDPTKAISRAVSITGVAGGTGGAFLVRGADLYGNPQTQTITATAGATTTNSTKAFKWIFSVTPQFTDAHNYSVGTTDIYGLPMRADIFIDLPTLFWNNVVVSAVTGFVAADTTNPATATTGDVRGTYAVQGAASNGTLRLVVYQSVRLSNLGAVPTTQTQQVGVWGVTPA